ncbi:MAG: M23 family metallopeptidase [Syntrophomonadaceae bacterium]|nr:M23 family metallopeptidase [Syntrophomonadaceae bacterium]
MYYRLTGILTLIILFMVTMLNPAYSALNRGNFIPVNQSKSSSANTMVRYYHVKKGDNLWDISRSFNVSLPQLMALNQVDAKTILSVGQKLKIPSAAERIHYIRKGETMWDIASRYEVSVDGLLSVNPGKNPTRLAIGDQLIIPDTRQPLTPQVSSRGISSMGAFSWPIMGIITSGFGWRKSGFHHGMDIAGDIGDPVKACAPGKVVFNGVKPVYGRTLIIEHTDGKRSWYAHLQKAVVSEGQKVYRGQTIGNVGMTGRTTGPHLHFEIRNNTESLNPLNYLSR